MGSGVAGEEEVAERGLLSAILDLFFVRSAIVVGHL